MDENLESLKLRMCTGKHKHKSFAAAQKQMMVGKRRKMASAKGLKLNVYRCRFCDGFHIGNEVKPKK